MLKIGIKMSGKEHVHVMYAISWEGLGGVLRGSRKRNTEEFMLKC